MPSIPAPLLDLAATLSCGQAFRWRPATDGWWDGVVGDRALRVRHVGGRLEFEGDLPASEVARYFALDHDLPAIYGDMRAASGNDEHLARAIFDYCGLRVLRQPPWETLATFIVTANNNVPRIAGIIDSLCRCYGEPMEGDAYGFPSPAALCETTLVGLKECGLGYRAAQLKAAAQSVEWGLVDLDALPRMPIEAAREALLAGVCGWKVLPGVGDKVADCVLLFGLGFTSAVPVDRNVAQLWAALYTQDETAKKEGIAWNSSKSPTAYRQVSRRFGERFGRHAGYAQQYLYHWWRKTGKKACDSTSA